MDELFAEHNKYLELSDRKEKLSSRIISLRGKNDDDTLKIINDIADELGDVNEELDKFDIDLIGKLNRYYDGLKKVSAVTEKIKFIEKLSKKATHNNDKVEVISDNGRSKYIDKEYAVEYADLVEKRREFRRNNLINYRSLEKAGMTLKKETIQNTVSESVTFSYVLPEVKGYESLSLDEKIKETRDRLDIIFNSSMLPNMGKKIIVSFEGKKYSIPEKFKGRFNSTVIEYNTLMNKKNNNKKIENNPVIENKEEKEVVTIPSVMPTVGKEKIIEEIPIPEYTSIKEDTTKNVISDKFNEIKESLENRVHLEFYPLGKISFREETPRLVMSKCFAFEKKKIDISRFKNILPSIFNIDKKTELLYRNAEKKVLDVSYVVVNRACNFKKDTCHRINEGISFITRISNKALDEITNYFDKLRESMHNDLERSELQKQIEIIKQENLKRKEEIRRVRVLTSGGYVAMGTLIVVGVIVLAALIFSVVGYIVR